MIPAKAYAAMSPKSRLEPFEFERRDAGPSDVLIDILYCGVCHSDIHQARDEWGGAIFPMVPGHEIVGKVLQVGKEVNKFKAGDTVGVGCLVNSCRTCPSCQEGLEQFCQVHPVFTYNGLESDKKTKTYGGYSTKVVVDQDFVLSVSPSLPLDQAAPLLCAGITTYSPLRHWKVQPGQKVAVAGLGGLGHMAVKLAAAMGAEVTVFSHSAAKQVDAKRFGASEFVSSSDQNTLAKFASHFDLMINTISSSQMLDAFLPLLKRDGTMVLVGAPEKPQSVHPFPLILGRRSLAGSLIGGLKETQEMLDFCAAKKITCDVELIPLQKINEAYERVLKSDVRYRFVIDLASIK